MLCEPVAASRQTFDVPPRSGGLFPTVWPADHGDTARRKFVVDGGLPEAIDPERIRTVSNAELLAAAMWIEQRRQI